MVVAMEEVVSFPCFPRECPMQILLEQKSPDLVTLQYDKHKSDTNTCLNESEKIIINFNEIYSKNQDRVSSDKTTPKQLSLQSGEEEIRERPFMCHVCGKKFRQRCHVDQHLRTHTNVRPYQCSYCTKSFKQKSQINQHERIHTGVKPYKCGMCAQAYPQATQLRYHMKSHLDNGCDQTLINFDSEKSKRGRPPKSSVTDSLGELYPSKTYPSKSYPSKARKKAAINSNSDFRNENFNFANDQTTVIPSTSTLPPLASCLRIGNMSCHYQQGDQ